MSSESDHKVWLILKRGYYFRPDAAGYTGIRDEAGLYTKAVAQSYVDLDDTHSMVLLSEAPEFSLKCDAYAQRDYLLKTRAQALQSARLQGREAGMREASAILSKAAQMWRANNSPIRADACEGVNVDILARAASPQGQANDE